MRICVVAARAGSKGLPNKNIRMFAGQPLLAHSVRQAVESGMFDVVAASSDSQEYLSIAREAGASLLIDRPEHLSGDHVAKAPVLHHALLLAEAETEKQATVLVDLQPTSPLRRPEDIAGAVQALEENPNLLNVISVVETKASPYFTLAEERPDGTLQLSKERLERVVRRQDVPQCFELNGSIYAWRRDAIVAELPALTERTGKWVMPHECGFDIDTLLDFEVAAFVAHHRFGWPAIPDMHR